MYRRPDKKNWKGREDILDGKEGLRWHQKIELMEINENIALPKVNPYTTNFALIGFCSDEGVRRNQGRLGAAEAPASLRTHLSNLPWHFEEKAAIFDMGDIFCLGEFLEDAQKDLGESVEKLLKSGYKTILLGGGHEIALGHYLGIRSLLIEKKARLGIINFDAHFDMRLSANNKPTSGTSFLNIAQDLRKNNLPFSYLVLGVQKVSNTPKLFQTAQEWGVEYIPSEKMDFMFIEYIYQKITNFMADKDILYVSICLDVFSAAYAPGVSALNGLGIYPTIVSDLLSFIAKSGKVLAFDVAELNPKFDYDGRTARLAASLIFSYVDACLA
ncbi:MAG: formimidoylglutamase [Raineya sp.]